MQVSKIKSSRDNVYLNVVIQPLASNGANNTVAKYNETLTIPVLSNPADYYMSVVRFSLPIDQIPLFKFPVEVAQANPNISYLNIGVRAGGVNYTQPIVYVPMNTLAAPVPSGGPQFFTNEQSVSEYYNIFSIGHMINMINTALGLAFVASGIAGTAPFYRWDPVSELISLFVSTGMVAAGQSVFVNKYLKDYLSSFHYLLDNSTFADDYLYYTQYDANNPIVGGFHEFKQEYVSIALWMDIRKILIVSRTMPVATEVLPDQITTQTSQLPVFSGLSSSLPIVSDFVLSYDQFNQISSVIVYNPSSVYRLVDMIGNTPINKIDLEFMYQDKYGNRFPIYLSPSNEASVKILFVKKTLY